MDYQLITTEELMAEVVNADCISLPILNDVEDTEEVFVPAIAAYDLYFNFNLGKYGQK